MSDTVRAQDGDRLDLICWNHYGSLDGRVVEIVLAANPELAMQAQLASGTPVELPTINNQRRHVDSLW